MAHEGAKTGLAKSLGTRMTPAERRLWSQLRDNRLLGLPFVRQTTFGPYIVDFYCSVARLVVELDGDAHAMTLERDQKRDEWLASEGVKVLRVPNWAVMNDLGSVLRLISSHCQGHLSGSNDF